MMRTIAIIVAAGEGKRMGRPKQFLKVAGRPMLSWTIKAFQKAQIIDGIVLVAGKANINAAKKLKFSKLIKVVEGGDERQDSVRNGLRELPETAEIVLIHDGARPAVTEDIISRSVDAAKVYGAAVVGVPVKDTLKAVSRRPLVISKTINRENFWVAQTPQAFNVPLINKAYAKLKGKVTDDAMAVEQLGQPVKLVVGSYQNLKVTTPEDLLLMGYILKGRRKT